MMNNTSHSVIHYDAKDQGNYYILSTIILSEYLIIMKRAELICEIFSYMATNEGNI